MKIRAAFAALGLATAASCLVAAPAHAKVPPTFGRWAGTTIQVYSSATTSWGVGKAVTQWNKNGVVTLVLVAQPCAGCITVTEGTPTVDGHDPSEFAGLAAPDVLTEDRGVLIGCQVTLNVQYATSFTTHGTTAHEIGHCLGFSHNSRYWSVMNDTGSHRFDRPTPRDLLWIAEIYG